MCIENSETQFNIHLCLNITWGKPLIYRLMKLLTMPCLLDAFILVKWNLTTMKVKGNQNHVTLLGALETFAYVLSEGF